MNEDTLKQIIEKQDKKIEGLTIILNNLIDLLYYENGRITTDESVNFKTQLNIIRNLK